MHWNVSIINNYDYKVTFKWVKQTKGQILYDSTCMQDLEQVNSWRQKEEQLTGGEESVENWFTRYRVSIWNGEKILEMIKMV